MIDPRDTETARALPHNLESEMALLGCIMFDNYHEAL